MPDLLIYLLALIVGYGLGYLQAIKDLNKAVQFCLKYKGLYEAKKQNQDQNQPDPEQPRD